MAPDIHLHSAPSRTGDDFSNMWTTANPARGDHYSREKADRLRNVAAKALRWRSAQRRAFPEAALHATCWDIMLLCFASQLEGRKMCVKQVRSQLVESSTSVLRRIDELQQCGMVQRQRDEQDGRRTMLRLSREGSVAMSRFLGLIDESCG